jgi:hypothetical protein
MTPADGGSIELTEDPRMGCRTGPAGPLAVAVGTDPARIRMCPAAGAQPLIAASTSSPYRSSLRAPMPGSPESSCSEAGRVSAMAWSVASVKTT